MLSLRDIVKTYTSGDSEVHALQGVSIDFRESEFVSILGPSGCGKTTMLNIIGGLDRYTSGDLIINGRSTKEYRDADWDTYRNHSIGFVFQSYNLIMHQTVLANVELALTLSGVSREERRARAIDALTQVGLGDQLHKKPNQMSGGQMQRVAIARALVNDPDILLADEPTGALDTGTSVQIMEILKKVSEKKLIIMVTHNPELAAEYSNRIIRVLDGKVIDDSNPYEAPAPAVTEQAEAAQEAAPAQKPKKQKTPRKAKNAADGKGKRSMSFFTALSLSFTNLLTKKTRTLLVSIAGSIGIIGIALILALSNGVNLFIATVQEDTLSTYPLTIQKHTQDMTAMMEAMMQTSESLENQDPNKIYVDDSMGTMMSAMSATVENNLKAFKAYIEANPDKLEGHLNDIRYTYDFDLQIFTADGKTQVNPTEIFKNMGDTFAGIGDLMSGMGVMSEMINNQELLDQQYELVGENSHWPTNKNEVVLVVNSNNQLSKMTLYMLGVLDQSELEQIMKDLMTKGEYDTTPLPPYEFDDFIGMKFKLLNTSDFFEKSGKKYTVDGKEYDQWYDVRELGFDQEGFVTANGMDLVISGIVRPRKGVAATSISGAIGYTKALTDYILEQNAKSEIINQQKNLTPNHSVLNGAPFERTAYTRENIDELIDRVGTTNMQRFYSVVTSMLRDDPQFEGIWSDKDMAITMYVSTLDDKKMAACIADLLENAKANDPTSTKLNMLFSALNNPMLGGPKDVPIKPENIVSLLPIMSDAQIMLLLSGMPANPPMLPNGLPGLNKICSSEKTDALFADIQSALASGEWQVNEKFITLMLESKTETGEPLLDDTMFATFEKTLYDMVPDKDATLTSNLKVLGDAEMADPTSINFYAVDFESKEYIKNFITEYNASVEEKDKLEYSDLVGTLMSSVTIIVDAISYVLIAFVSISLVVSSIMIGIITYISVLERTKEIGVLRAIGASKRDISRVFNAETLIIGFAAGAIGILTTLLLCIPINAILRAVTDMQNIRAVLPVAAAFILVGISMLLTLIAGVIPSRIASKKDPVEALRSE